MLIQQNYVVIVNEEGYQAQLHSNGLAFVRSAKAAEEDSDFQDSNPEEIMEQFGYVYDGDGGEWITF